MMINLPFYRRRGTVLIRTVLSLLIGLLIYLYVIDDRFIDVSTGIPKQEEFVVNEKTVSSGPVPVHRRRREHVSILSSSILFSEAQESFRHAFRVPERSATSDQSLDGGYIAGPYSHVPIVKRDEFSFLIIVFAWRRTYSLQRLLRSLAAAYYDGYSVGLTIMVEGEATPSVEALASNFTWVHGQKNVRYSVERRGLQRSIMSAWYPTSDNEFAVFLEDDTEVSPLWYRYTRLLLDAYIFEKGYRIEPQLAGFSLYTPRLNEIAFPPVTWKPNIDSDRNGQPFRFQLPCSWGAIYFPWVWRSFLSFYNIRTTSVVEEHMLPIPDSRSNSWRRSWKRYMIEFFYGRGDFLIYPNFPDQASLSTTHKESGEHTGKVGRVQEVTNSLLEDDVKDYRFTVPLLRDDATLDPLRDGGLVGVHHLQLVTLHHQNRTSEVSIKAEGFNFINQVNAHSPLFARTSFRDLLSVWSSVSRGCAMDSFDLHDPSYVHIDHRRRGGNEQGKERYLLYQPQNGFSNQARTLVDAIAFSRILNRTLVLPHMRSDNGLGQFRMDWKDAFDPVRLHSLLGTRWLHIDELIRKNIRPERMVSVYGNTKYLYPNMDYFTMQGLLPPTNRTIPIYVGVINDIDVRRLFGSCRDDVLTFNTLYHVFSRFYDDTEQALFQDDIDSLLVPHPRLLSLVNGIAKSIGSFSCVHLRRGDFEEYCHFLQKEAKDPNHKPWLHNFELERCYPSLDTVKATMRRAGIAGSKIVYMASDHEDPDTLRIALSDYIVVMLSDIQGKLVDVPADLIPWIEQVLCSSADTFIGNYYSTFTKSIVKLRERRGIDEKKVVSYFKVDKKDKSKKKGGKKPMVFVKKVIQKIAHG